MKTTLGKKEYIDIYLDIWEFISGFEPEQEQQPTLPSHEELISLTAGYHRNREKQS